MIELELFDRARVALRHCALMESGDQVLLVSDGTLSPRILTAFATAAHADGESFPDNLSTASIHSHGKVFYLRRNVAQSGAC